MDIVDCIIGAGYGVVGPIGSLIEALRVASLENVDAALLDANLGGEKVDGVAAALAERKIPFAFVTGYAREKISADFNHVPLVAKPFQHEMLKQVIRNLLARPDMGGLENT
jgi:DNA-binding LytR/AlgR family response regulator